MRKSGSPHLQQVSWMDTRQCITQRSFYERVLDSVQQRDVELRKGSIESTSLVVDNLDSFSRYLARALESDKQEDRILVFDHYSFTQFDNSEAIMTVIKEVLQSLDGHAIAIFVVSHYSDIPRTFVMPTIQFRLYSSSDIFMLMQQDCERAYEGVDCVAEAQWPLVWERYCNTIYGTFVELVGHDLQLYRILAKKLLHAYLEPVRQHRLEATNHVQLARAAQAVMAKEAWVLDEEQIPVATPQISSGASQLRRAAQETELSISMRYLLIAAFLASYNPVKTDVMFFSKGHGLAKKRRAASSKHAKAEQLPQRILGPKGFPIERMVAIYQAILPSTLLYDITIDQQASDPC
jgi:origin recognition complex subunit 5